MIRNGLRTADIFAKVWFEDGYMHCSFRDRKDYAIIAKEDMHKREKLLEGKTLRELLFCQSWQQPVAEGSEQQ
jgi:hypothetical protein